MKRIEFIAPVESMRGNLSGNQDLLYALNDNKAFESPKGQVNYAKNYQPRFIGAKVAARNLKYFAVKTKSAVHTTLRALYAMALLGASAAVYALMADKSKTAQYNAVLLSYENRGPEHANETMRKYFMNIIRRALEAGYNTISLSSHLKFNNPWRIPATPVTVDYTIHISSTLLIKFWEYLSGSQIFATFGGRKQPVYEDNMTFDDICAADGTTAAYAALNIYNVGYVTALQPEEDVQIPAVGKPAVFNKPTTVEVGDVVTVLGAINPSTGKFVVATSSSGLADTDEDEQWYGKAYITREMTVVTV